MATAKLTSELIGHVRQFVRRGYKGQSGRRAEEIRSDPVWSAMRRLGTELWLDTGDIDDAGGLWTREFTALTTNNTLLNREVQKGIYDDVIVDAARMLGDFGLDEHELMLEIAFILNAIHGLKLVDRFDAYVSVEEHTDLAGDLPGAVEYARRYYDICPERFIVKIPFTPAGLLATRDLSRDGIPVNHTLGFSARQNYVIARLGRPSFVNVFMGRLNSFVIDNKLGDGKYIGERATLASQAAVRKLRQTSDVHSLQIGASFRQAQQVRDLAGMDVMTIPPKVAQGFLDLNLQHADIKDRTGEQYPVSFAESVDPQSLRIDSLWAIEPGLEKCVDDLEQENLDAFTPEDIVDFLGRRGCGDFLVNWTDEQIALSYKEGKIPQIANWRASLAGGEVALDSLMNLAGLNSFKKDQQEMDERVRTVLEKAGHRQ